MIRACFSLFAVLATLCLATPGGAQADLERFRACFTERMAANQPAGDCVNAAQDLCLSFDPDAQTEAATLCFSDARRDWSDGIGAQLAELGKTAAPEISAIASIEVKYDLLSNLLQCDRMQDLALLGEAPVAAIALQKARCEATATGLVLTKLMLQSR